MSKEQKKAIDKELEFAGLEETDPTEISEAYRKQISRMVNERLKEEKGKSND